MHLLHECFVIKSCGISETRSNSRLVTRFNMELFQHRTVSSFISGRYVAFNYSLEIVAATVPEMFNRAFNHRLLFYAKNTLLSVRVDCSH